MSTENGLDKAWEVQQAASKAGFDWDTIEGALTKVSEEVREVRDAFAAGDAEAAREELGDLLFSVVNVSRFVNVHPNDALLDATQKFSRRFDAVCTEIATEGRNVHECSLQELDAVWDRIKGSE